MELELIKKLLYKWVDKIVEDLEKGTTETVEYEPPKIIDLSSLPKATWGRGHRATKEEKEASALRKKEYMKKYREKNRDKLRKQQMEAYYKRRDKKRAEKKMKEKKWENAGQLYPQTNEDLVFNK